MPSVCELKVELKAKGIKGITGLNKAGLQALLNKAELDKADQKALLELEMNARLAILKIKQDLK